MNFFSLQSEERLSPSEIILQRDFFGDSNVDVLLSTVRKTVDNLYSGGDVADIMHDVFTTFLGENFNASASRQVVSTLNERVVASIKRRKMFSKKASQISRKVGFETSKIPTKIMPRASFSLESENDFFEFI